MIIPFEVRVIPMFLIIRGLNWVNTYQALIVPFIVDAFGVYLFREFIRTIPSDYLDAARIDGASEWRIYQRVVLPLTTSVMSALAIFAFVYYWDMLIWPLVAVSSQEMKTLPVGMLLLTNQRGGIYDLLLAAGLLGVVPNLIMFLIFQRQIVKGVILAGLKG
jgi:multiple sugar transport system permease protein